MEFVLPMMLNSETEKTVWFETLISRLREGSVAYKDGKRGTALRRGMIAFENTMKSTFIRTPLNHEISTTNTIAAQTHSSLIFWHTNFTSTERIGRFRPAKGWRSLSCSLITTMTNGYRCI